MPRDLRDAVVVVSGASSGVGRAAALAFAELGASVVVAARGPDALAEVADACRARGVAALAVPGDVADAAAVDELGARAVATFGRIDVWVEAAAVLLAGRFGEEPVDEVERLVATNVLGSVHGARTALRQFRRQGHGTLVLVSSVLGVVQNPVVPVYVMSKFAVRGLGLSLRHLVAQEPGIAVTVVLPGPIDTPMFERAANHTGFGLRSVPPAIAPERVAAAVVSAARRPRRQVPVGFTARAILLADRVAPRLTEWTVARVSASLLVRREPVPDTSGAVLEPGRPARPHGPWRRSRLRRRAGAGVGWVLTRHGR